MVNKDRTYNSISNSIYGILSYFIILIVTFLSRKIFATSLGEEFLGLNSLFSNFVTMLSLPELGLSTAMLFFLYKPVAEKNKEKICAFLNFYKKIYNWIGLGITFVGIIFSFFLNIFVHSSINSVQIQIYFILYLLGTTVTYFYAYKKNILYADQQNRVISITHTVCKTLFEIIQMIIIFYSHNYIFYLILLIIFNFLENFYCSYYVNKTYKDLLIDKNILINSAEKKLLYKKIRDLLIQNISGFIVTFTDNLLISFFLNTVVVAIYSNYILITTTLKTIFSQIFSAFTTSFGNLYVTESKEHSYDVYLKSQFFANWFVGFTAIAFFSLIQEFITLWLGKQYLFDLNLVLIITIVYYVNCINVPSISVQNALGIHYMDKNIMLLQSFINLVVSFILGSIMGVTGIMLGTIIATIFPVISKPYIIYVNVFEKPFAIYIKNFLFWILLTVFSGTVTFYITNILIQGNINIITFLLKMIISLIIPNMIFILFNFKNENFKYFYNLLITIIRNVITVRIKK